MDNSSATKVADFAKETFGLINQLRETLKDDQEKFAFLFFSEIITPKFNTLAHHMWEKETTKNESKSYVLGLSLGLEDLEKVITKTKSRMRNREYNKQFDSGKPPEKDPKEKKDQDGKMTNGNLLKIVESRRAKKKMTLKNCHSF